MTKHPISIIIPVYKNYQMFFKYLNINKKYFNGCEVIIMNDYPLQNITADIKKIYPQAKVVNNKKNLGFAGNVNAGVKKAHNKYIFLMNSDVVLKDNSFINSIKYFYKNTKLFAVGFAQQEKNNKIVGANSGFFQNGFICHSTQPISSPHSLISNFWAEGGSSMFNKKLFIQLGLLDELYNPFYWEDIDLSYRAWKAGYEIKYDPSILVEHHHESTIGKYFDKTKILKTVFRNQLIFQWKNITDKKYILIHISLLVKQSVMALIKRDQIFISGLFNALKMLPDILKSRKIVKKIFIYSDEKILSIFKP